MGYYCANIQHNLAEDQIDPECPACCAKHEMVTIRVYGLGQGTEPIFADYPSTTVEDGDVDAKQCFADGEVKPDAWVEDVRVPAVRQGDYERMLERDNGVVAYCTVSR